MSPSLVMRAAAIAAALSLPVLAQNLNCKMLAHVDKFPGAVSPNNNYAGVWGYVGSNGKEYAVVPARTGTVFYDCSNPAAPVEIAFIPGPGSGSTPYFWREANGYKSDYIYLSSEHGALQVVNVTNPGAPVLSGTFGGSAHTVTVDEGAKKLWASGGTYNGCGVFDLAVSFTNPPKIGGFSNPYVHDCLPIRGYGYFAQIFDGNFQIRDISNPAGSLPVLSTTKTPGNFTHNVWVTDDDKIAITADENRGGCLAVYDIANKALPVLKSSWCSPNGATVHNVFIKGNVAHFSCYSDGYWAVDISVPTAPKPIAHYDTSNYSGNDYHGNWGCYPYQPSGVIYLSDMQSGFWIVEPTSGVPNLYGNGTAGKGGFQPTIDYAGGYAKVGNSTFQIAGQKMLGGAPALLVLGTGAANTPVFGINLLVDLALPNVLVSTTASGTAGAAGAGAAAVNVPIPNNPALALGVLYSQWVVVDAAAPGGLVSASRGMKVVISP